MTLEQYNELTGLTVSSSNEARVNAIINRTQMILEDMLGLTLDPELINDNFYIESGKTSTDCPCGEINEDNLQDADAIVNAYRIFPYNRDDKYLSIDPSTAIHAVKLVRGNITVKTLETDDYRPQHKNGIIKYLEQCQCWCGCWGNCGCDCVELAVDADWLWDEGDVPTDLLHVWADMVTYYSDDKNNIKSQTLGSHSYTKFDKEAPQNEAHNIAVIKKYAGPLGSIRTTVTI